MTDLPPNSSFSRQLPTLQFAFDSVSLGALKKCPRYYYYLIIKGYQFDGKENVHLTFGLAYHSSLELYDRAKAEGLDHDAAVHIALTHTLKITWNEELNRPWSSDDPNKNRETLIQTIIWYLDQFKDDPAKTVILANGKPAVELSYRYNTGVGLSTGDELILCGHIDRLVEWEQRNWLVDRKTTKFTLSASYFAKYSPNNQISGYIYAGQLILSTPVAGMIIDAAQIAVGFSRFQRGLISRSPSQLDEWFKDSIHHIRQADMFAQENYWPQNDEACGIPHVDEVTGEIQGGCPFRAICSATPEIRDELLNGMFKRRIWDPLVTREI